MTKDTRILANALADHIAALSDHIADLAELTESPDDSYTESIREYRDELQKKLDEL